MPRRVSDLPAESELEVLSILWKEGPCTVRKVHELLQGDGRETSMTTTLKTMQIMVEKGFLKCGDKRPAVYVPTVAAERTQGGLVKRLAAKAFEGSVGKLLVRAVEEGDLSEEELKEIRRVIECAGGAGTERRRDRETGRQGDRETGRQGDKVTR